jgi:hypothetical protein
MLARFTFRKNNSAASTFGSWVSKAFNHKVLVKNPIALTLVLMSAALAITVFVMNASDWFASNSPAKEASVAKNNSPTQANASKKGVLNARLSVEPEVNLMRRRLGKRFLGEGNTITEMVGWLTVGTQQQPIRIIRGFNENGEAVQIAPGGPNPNLMWSDTDGAVANGSQATGETRALIERLALDSPDQFVLAKLRGTAYQITARNVRPAEAGGDSDYKGPLWNLVEVSEPQQSPDKAPLSAWRQYYINASTGLIDRILSQENGQIVTAEITGWTQQGGETFPAKITWSREKQTLMELSVNAVIFKSRQ